MPIYEYKCRECGDHIEIRQSVSDAPLTVCEKCSGTLEKQWSRTGFQFKGDGWYVTDYASKKPGASEKSSAGESTTKSDDASKQQPEKPAPSKPSGDSK